MARRAKLTIEMPEEDFARLQAESLRTGVRPETKVLEFIARSLPPQVESATSALDRLRELRKSLPLADAVEVIRAVRDDLEERAAR